MVGTGCVSTSRVGHVLCIHQVAHCTSILSSLCLEHLCPRHLGLRLEIRTVEVCGSDEWQIDLQEG